MTPEADRRPCDFWSAVSLGLQCTGQPIWFAPPKLFINRPAGNSFYTSSTQVNGRCVLWYNDQKYYLLGKVIDEGWFKDIPPMT